MDPLPWYRVAAPVAFVVGLAVLCAVRPVPRFRAMPLGIAALSGYGMLQDQVSARLCPEYFTVLHPPIPGLADPTLLGVAWGFLGAWWGGALLGYFAGITATAGGRPPLMVRELVRPVLVLVGGVAFVTAVTGASVALYADMFDVIVPPDPRIAPNHQRSAFVVACYHFAAYVTAVAGSVALCVWVASERKRRTSTGVGACPSPSPSSSGSTPPRSPN